MQRDLIFIRSAGGVLGQAPNSRYRVRVTPASVRKFKNPAADLEADGLEEPDLTVASERICVSGKYPILANDEGTYCVLGKVVIDAQYFAIIRYTRVAAVALPFGIG